MNVEMLDITGDGTQRPMRSHWKLCPDPQSYLYNNSKQQSKRYRANSTNSTATTGTPRTDARRPQPTAAAAARHSARVVTPAVITANDLNPRTATGIRQGTAPN